MPPARKHKLLDEEALRHRRQFVAHLVERHFKTQGAMADAAGVHQTHISRVKDGFDNLSIEACLRLALVAFIDPVDLWLHFGHERFVEDLFTYLNRRD